MPSRTTMPADSSAVLALLLLSAIWGYNFVVMKQVLAYVDPFVFTAARSVLGALALFVFAWFTGRRLQRPSWGPLISIGILQTTAFGALIQWALVSEGAGRTVVIVYAMPFWLVAMAAVFLGERLRTAQLLAVAAAAAGLLLILQPWAGIAPSGTGAALALLAGAIWAVAAVIARKSARRPGDTLLAMTAWQMLIGSLVLCAIAWFVPTTPLSPSPYLWGALAYSAVLATGLAWFLWLFILERMSAGGAGLSTLLIPVVGIAASWLQLGERPDQTTAWGMFLILLALLGLSLARQRLPPQKPTGPSS